MSQFKMIKKKVTTARYFIQNTLSLTNSFTIEAGFGIFLCLSGNGELSFENSGKIAVEVGDAVVNPYAAGTFTVNNCAGILSRPPAIFMFERYR